MKITELTNAKLYESIINDCWCEYLYLTRSDKLSEEDRKEFAEQRILNYLSEVISDQSLFTLLSSYINEKSVHFSNIQNSNEYFITKIDVLSKINHITISNNKEIVSKIIKKGKDCGKIQLATGNWIRHQINTNRSILYGFFNNYEDADNFILELKLSIPDEYDIVIKKESKLDNAI